MWELFLILLHACLCRIVADGKKSSATEAMMQPKDVQKAVESRSLADFFQEPKLGTSWYNPSGPTPAFDMNQKNGTVYVSRLGTDLFMSCMVTALEKDLVSWLRRDSGPGPVASPKSPSSIPVLLTVGFLTHSFDSRFSVDFLPPRDYRLKVTNVGWQDAGIYLCQLAVHPPSLIWTRLDIDPPVVHILDSEEAPVWELHYDVGTTVEMVCRVKRPPLQGPHVVEWEARTSSEKTVRSLHRDVERGGVKVDTGMDEKSGYLISRISLASARVSDTGNYTCRLGGVPTEIRHSYNHLQDTIVVHVLEDRDITKAIHHSLGTRLKPELLLYLLHLLYFFLPRQLQGRRKLEKH